MSNGAAAWEGEGEEEGRSIVVIITFRRSCQRLSTTDHPPMGESATHNVTGFDKL